MTEQKITLDYPLVIDGKEIGELTMRRAKVRDSISASEAGTTAAHQEVALFSKLVGLNPEDMQEIDMSDYVKIQRAYQDFLASKPKTAE